MDPNEILTKILRRYGTLSENIRATQIVESKIQKKIATYADAEDMSIRIGKALTTALREHLPEALTDGRLYRAVAEVVVEQPMKAAGKDIAKITSAIQKELNEEAGIGMNPIVPAMNQDQIDGIINGICNADSYEAGKNTMFAQVENALEGYVDDFVRENADFQSKAGLFPTIERKVTGKCCAWCAKLAGSYPYEDVSDRGNDVFRRHKHCHCQILFNPGNGSKRRQNVHNKQWTDEGKADRIRRAETETEIKQLASAEITNLRNEYVGRSVGAKAQNYDILDLRTGEMFHLSEGTYLRDKKVFAGKGTKVPYRDAYKYAERFGGKEEDWQHVKAVGTIDYEGESRNAEIHWSQCESYGKHDFFIKEWLD